MSVRKQSMPDQEAFAKNREDATFKERQLESSKSTMERLSSQREQRQLELEKVANLDEKIKVELGSLTGKMESMRSEMGAFDDLDGQRSLARCASEGLCLVSFHFDIYLHLISPGERSLATRVCLPGNPGAPLSR